MFSCEVLPTVKIRAEILGWTLSAAFSRQSLPVGALSLFLLSHFSLSFFSLSFLLLSFFLLSLFWFSDAAVREWWVIREVEWFKALKNWLVTIHSKCTMTDDSRGTRNYSESIKCVSHLVSSSDHAYLG